MKTKFLLLSAITITFLQCSKISEIIPDKTVAAAPTPPKITKFGASSPENIFAIVRVGINLQSYLSSAIPTLPNGIEIPPIDYTTAIASLGNPGKEASGEIKVTVASVPYVLTKTTQSGSVSYVYGISSDFKNLAGSESYLGIPLKTSGDATATFSIPASYNLSQNSIIVPGPVKITSIKEGETLNKSNGITVEFSSGNGNFYAAMVIDTKGNQTVLKEANSKKITFTSTELANLKSGDAIVYGLAINYKLSNSNKNVVVGESVGIKNIKIN